MVRRATAPGMAVAGLIHHSDACSEYLSIRYSAALAEAGIIPSVGTVGDSYDNALAETMIGLYKTEVINHQGPWETIAQVEAATGQWVGWYNTRLLWGRSGTARRRNTSSPGATERWSRGRNANKKEAAMAAAHYPKAGSARARRGSAPGPGPPQRRPGQAGGGRAGAGVPSPARARPRATPGQVKGASGVAGDDAARHPGPGRGTRGRESGAPDEEMPAQPCHAAGTSPAGQPARRAPGQTGVR